MSDDYFDDLAYDEPPSSEVMHGGFCPVSMHSDRLNAVLKWSDGRLVAHCKDSIDPKIKSICAFYDATQAPLSKSQHWALAFFLTV